MKYTIILTEEMNGTYSANVPILPECTIKAKTRQEALEAIQKKIKQIINRSEVIQIDISAKPRSGSIEETPWDLFGSFKENSEWADLFDEIKAS